MVSWHVLAALGAGLLSAALSASLEAQHVEAGGGYALAEYSEQTPLLAFHGSGPTATAQAELGRFTLVGNFTRLSMKPATHGTGTLAAFTLSDADVGLRFRVHPMVSLETVFQRRSITPTGEAQEFAAVRIGARAEYPLAPGAMVTGRLGYVGANSFSGGGTAPFGAVLGLGFAYGPGAGHVRVVGDYAFQRIDRQTAVTAPTHISASVPIASSIGRLGLTVRF